MTKSTCLVRIILLAEKTSAMSLSFIHNITMLKKLFTWIVAPLFATVWVLSLAVAPMSVEAQFTNPNPYTDPNDPGWSTAIDIIGTGEGQWDNLVNVVKWFVNRVLGILALIALLVLLWGWFQMVTAAGNEERYNAGFKILKEAAAWLALIGIAWFIISIIFFVIGLVTSTWTWGAGTA